MAVRVLCALLVVSALGVVSPVCAWTRAEVRDVRALVELDHEGRARVTLDLGLSVRGGWLERLDLSGLDEDLVPDATEPAWLTTADGMRVLPEVRARDGGMSLRFTKEQAPRRGLHRVGVRYQTVLLGRTSERRDEQVVRLYFALPGWEDGLDAAEIRWVVPHGTRAVRDEHVAQTIGSDLPMSGKSVLRFSRVHLPRDTAWRAAVDVPARALRVDRTAAALGRAQPKSTRSWLSAGGVTAFLLVLGWFARATARRRSRAEGFESRPLLAGKVGMAVRCLLCGAAVTGWMFALPIALGALTLLALTMMDRTNADTRALPLGAFVPLVRADFRQLRRARLRAWLGDAPWCDVTTALGCLGALTLIACLVRSPGAFDTAGDPWGLGVLCALLSWVVSSRFVRPRTGNEQVRLLVSAARRTLALSSTMRLMWYRPHEGQPCQPRLRIVPAARHPGLLRVDVAVDTRRDHAPLLLVIVVEAGSACDRWLAGTGLEHERELSEGSRRTVYVRNIADVGEALEQLFNVLAAGSQRAVDAQTADSRRAA